MFNILLKILVFTKKITGATSVALYKEILFIRTVIFFQLNS